MKNKTQLDGMPVWFDDKSICKTAQHVIGNTKDTVCHQHPLVDQLQLANIGKVVLVDEGH